MKEDTLASLYLDANEYRVIWYSDEQYYSVYNLLAQEQSLFRKLADNLCYHEARIATDTYRTINMWLEAQQFVYKLSKAPKPSLAFTTEFNKFIQENGSIPTCHITNSGKLINQNRIHDYNNGYKKIIQCRIYAASILLYYMSTRATENKEEYKIVYQRLREEAYRRRLELNITVPDITMENKMIDSDDVTFDYDYFHHQPIGKKKRNDEEPSEPQDFRTKGVCQKVLLRLLEIYSREGFINLNALNETEKGELFSILSGYSADALRKKLYNDNRLTTEEQQKDAERVNKILAAQGIKRRIK